MIIWNAEERAQAETGGRQWRHIVHQVHRLRHPWRVKFAQWLRRLTAWVEP